MREVKRLSNDVTDRYLELKREDNDQNGYVIVFTPRCGSSWLGNLLSETWRLGNPIEHFNGGWIKGWANHLGTDNLYEYAELIKYQDRRGGIFGTEISYDHIDQIGGPDVFVKLFPDSFKYFLMYRRDIVSQAVSMAKASMSNIYHSVEATEDEIKKGDESFVYKPDQIRFWLNSIANNEINISRMQDAYQMKFDVICYEEEVQKSKDDVISRFSSAMGVTVEKVPEGSYKKIGTDKNKIFKERFEEENADLVREVYARRPAPFI